MQLLNPNGCLLSYSECLSIYGLPVPVKEYAIVFDTVLPGVSNCTETVVNDLTTTGSCCFLCWTDLFPLCKEEKHPWHTYDRTAYWNTLYRDLEWKKIWNLPSKFLLTIKIQEIYLINIHRFYPTRTFLLWLMLTVHFVTVRNSFTYLSPAYVLYVLWLLSVLWKNIVCLFWLPCK